MGGRGANNEDLEKDSSDSLDFSKDKDIWAYRHNPNDGISEEQWNKKVKEV